MSSTSLVRERPAGAAAVQVTALLQHAEENRLAGDYRAGSAIARQAATLAAAAGDLAGEAEALRSLANQLLRLGEQENAANACREAVAVLETVGDEAALCQVLTLQAMPLNELGMHEEALDVLARGREIAQRLGDRDLLYWVHNRTGVVHGSMGNRSLSTEYLMRALTIVDGMDAEARFCILNNVGDNAVYQVAQLRSDGHPDAADETLQTALGLVDEALRLARDAANPFRESICLDNYGMLLALDGDFAEAGRMIEDSRAIAAIHGYRSLESAALQHQAHVRLMRGECAAAIDGLLEALDRALEAGEKPMAMEIHRELSEAYEQVGNFAAALGHYRSFHTLEREAHNDVAAARARMAVHHFELDNARLEANNLRLEAELHRVRSAELEADSLSWQRQASEDALTGLPNRRYVELRLPELAATGPLCVAVADVDLFKGVNDRFGHFVGDEVLRQIAALLRDNVRDNDLVARFGGEEFLIALGGVDTEDARARCEVLRAQVAAYPWDCLQEGLAVTISIGLAIVGEGGDLPAGLTLADQRLYAAKNKGRNRVEADA
ncbi:GGDEF domain-containing protein [Actinoplanes friuliensis]|uniref:Diguanylate cyclase n=1 Tax=Actinoplanes friuliensis DSM 7358 TaxID=1246995 RepID=U5W7P8_9ACTN|nr:GGDEF domain-containing protein [Actinoplanes friuliensis]AGZ45144.1 diguanylate cyclase [Actinoplanes friuliensis DSM 7358]